MCKVFKRESGSQKMNVNMTIGGFRIIREISLSLYNRNVVCR